MDELVSRRAEITIYALAALTYIAAGIWQKFLLNWIIGPIWLVAWVELAPRVARGVSSTVARLGRARQ